MAGFYFAFKESTQPITHKEVAMQRSEKALTARENFNRDLSPINLPGKTCGPSELRVPDSTAHPAAYEIVPDGVRFGIALGNEVNIHGMDLARAKSTVAILNSIMKSDRAS